MPSIATNSQRTVYPTAPGYSLSGWDTMKAAGYASNVLGGSAGAQARMTSGGGGAAAAVSGADSSGTPQGQANSAATIFGGSAVVAVITLVVLLAAIWWLAHKSGKESEFANIRASAVNILLITLVAIVGILMLKVIFSHVKVPGLSVALQAV